MKFSWSNRRVGIPALVVAAAIVMMIGIGGRSLVRATTEWNDVVLIYHTDCKGQIDPCG